MEQVLLNNGVKMPVEGFGVFQISDEAQCWQCVLDALETGYRLFDTTAAKIKSNLMITETLRWNVPARL